MMGDKVWMDGIHIQQFIFSKYNWGSYSSYDTYALNEFIFKVSDNGQLYIDAKYNKVI
jgi:hypothetical protein